MASGGEIKSTEMMFECPDDMNVHVQKVFQGEYAIPLSPDAGR